MPALRPVHGSTGHRISRVQWPSALAVVVGLVVLFGGYRRMTDPDLPDTLIKLAHGVAAPINPHEGFKFEGVLADAGLYLLGLLGLGPEPTAFLFWGIGLAAVAAVVLRSLRDGSISLPGLLVVLALTRIVDTFAMWIGKTDPWLVACVVLSANRSRSLSRLGLVLAAFVHPMIALLSAFGLLAVQAYYDGKPRWLDAVLALLATGLALMLFRLVFPEMQGRGGYLLQQLAYVGLRGLEDGLPSLVAGLGAPVAALLVVAGFRPGRNGLMLVVLFLWLAGVGVLTSFFTLDHTRDACLITLAASLAWLRHQDVARLDWRPRAAGGTLAALFVARLVVPHYDQDGAHVFRWPPITRWSEPIIGRILDADAARCAEDRLRCVYHRNPTPEIRIPTL